MNQPATKPRRLLHRTGAFLYWMAAFMKALILSQIRVATLILFPKTHPVRPGFFIFPLTDLSDLEILLLSHSITLTPGTSSVDVDTGKRELLVHALEAGDTEAAIEDIRDNLLRPLLAFTRS